MKTKIALIISALIALSSIAQNGVNYKAIIKDGNGDLFVDQPVTVQFEILQGAAMTTVYSESHAINTDTNGLVMVNIGEGATGDDFTTVNWSSDQHYLNVQVNTGSGLVDMGTTEFKTVPYALNALTSSDNKWTENTNGINTSNNAVGINSAAPEHTLDIRSTSQTEAAELNLSNSDKTRNLRFFTGNETFTDPAISWVPGNSLLFATFDDNTLAFNEFMRMSSLGDVGIGMTDPEARLDILGGDWDLDSGNPGDLRIGNATHNFRIGVATGGGGAGITRLYTNSNALILGTNDTPRLIIEPDGSIKAPSLDNGLIESAGNKALVTKEYVDASAASGLETLDEGNGIGYRLIGKDPDNYGEIGLDAVDLSSSTSYSIARGATGDFSFAAGHGVIASGDYSSAIGTSTVALEPYSIAMGTSSRANGKYSISIGYASAAYSFQEIAIGTFNTYYESNSTTSYDPSDRLFGIGNGTSITNRSNAFTVLKNGNIGVQTSTPVNKFQITGGADASLSNSSGYLTLGAIENVNIVLDNNEILARNNGNNSTLYVQAEGGATSFGGSMYLNGTLLHSSDRRLKKDIETLPYGLDAILRLQPKAYNWHDRTQDTKSFGLIAQEVREVVGHLVEQKDDAAQTLTVNYTELIPVLIKALQEQNQIIQSQGKAIESSKNQYRSLQDNYESLVSRMEQLEAKQSN